MEIILIFQSTYGKSLVNKCRVVLKNWCDKPSLAPPPTRIGFLKSRLSSLDDARDCFGLDLLRKPQLLDLGPPRPLLTCITVASGSPKSAVLFSFQVLPFSPLALPFSTVVCSRSSSNIFSLNFFSSLCYNIDEMPW